MRRGPLLARRPLRRLAVPALAAPALLAAITPVALAHRAATGASAPSAAKVALGKKVFRANCGGCHTLTAAGTHGKIGPNLGLETLKYATVVWEVKNGNSTMPGFGGTLTSVQIDQVAAFVIIATS